jgi:chaperonin GroEL
MSKLLCSGKELHEKIKSGANTLADNVASTLGPRGRNVLIKSKTGRPTVTKDGVTVAKFIDLEDPVENAAAAAIKQASARTNIVAGDGTTTSTVLARRMVCDCLDKTSSGTPPVELKRSIDKIVDTVVEKLHELSRPIYSERDVAHIATISANNDRSIGDLIALAVDRVGKNGSITIEEGRSSKTSLDLVEGFRFDSGYVAQAFVTDERRSLVKYDDPMYLITDSRLEQVEQILPALEIAARASRPFVIVADDVTGQALAALIMNAVRGTMKVVAVKAPRFGAERADIMADLALSLGAKFFRKEQGDSLKEIDILDFGSSKNIEISKNHTVISGAPSSQANEVQAKIQSLEAQASQSDSEREASLLQERITRLASAVAVIHVGGNTEIEMVETKHRIEDALEAVNAALEDGVLPGGGATFVRIANDIMEEYHGSGSIVDDTAIAVVHSALTEPLRIMCENAGTDFEAVFSKISSSPHGQGYNFMTDEFCDLYEAGVIDPTKVSSAALVNAASVATTLMTTNYSIIEC